MTSQSPFVKKSGLSYLTTTAFLKGVLVRALSRSQSPSTQEAVTGQVFLIANSPFAQQCLGLQNVSNFINCLKRQTWHFLFDTGDT